MDMGTLKIDACPHVGADRKAGSPRPRVLKRRHSPFADEVTDGEIIIIVFNY